MGAIGLRGASRRMREISLFVTFFLADRTATHYDRLLA